MNLAVSYSDYLRRIKVFGLEGGVGGGIEDLAFKSDPRYACASVLECVSNDEAKMYLELISSEYGLSYIHIVDFARMNDRYGRPKTNTFTYFDKNKGVGGSWVVISASPTSLRYIYHALVILDHYMGVGGSGGIIEVGCGYGGLFLAICYFSKILGVRLGEYTMIDLPGVVDLIRKYLLAHPLLTFGVSYRVLEMCPTGYCGGGLFGDGCFFISNGFFTEMDEVYRKQLFASGGIVKHGFIVWQTVFGVSIDSVGQYLDKGVFPDVVVEERPQMACANYFVRF
jgi:hypothetical protein